MDTLGRGTQLRVGHIEEGSGRSRDNTLTLKYWQELVENLKCVVVTNTTFSIAESHFYQ